LLVNGCGVFRRVAFEGYNGQIPNELPHGIAAFSLASPAQ
jgi:hypothetical protein